MPEAAHPAKARIARSTGVLAATTGVSRVLGFIRDILMARLFGTSVQAEAFVVAFRLPNLMRDFAAEGAMTSAFVPVLSWYRAKGRPGEFWHLTQALLARVLVVLGILGLAGSLAAPLVVRLIAPGFLADPAKYELTVWLTRLLFPLIIFVGLWAFFMGLLNTLHHFALPALGSGMMNVAMIVTCVWELHSTAPSVLVLAVGVLIGGLLQFLVQLPEAHRRGFRWRLRWNHPGSREIVRLFGPRVLGSAVYQASVFIDTALASLSAIVGDGAVAALYFANRLIQLPMALFGTASAQASLPSLAEQAAAKAYGAFGSTVCSVLRMLAFVILPSSVGLMVLAGPMVGVLFERGAFTHGSTVMTAQAVGFYAIGLFAYSASKVVSGAFYALKDTRTPVRLAVESLLLNVLLSLILMWPLRLGGLALAAALSNTQNAYRLTRRLEQRLGVPLLAPLAEPALRMLVAAGLMGLGCWAIWRASAPLAHGWLRLAGTITAGIGLYATACRLIGVQELGTVMRWMMRLQATPPSVDS